MNKIILFQCSPSIKEFAKDCLPDTEFLIEDSNAEASSIWLKLEEIHRTVDLIIVGGLSKDPIRISQKIHFIDRNISVLLLASSEGLASLSHAVHMSPLLGSEVSIQTEKTGPRLKNKILSAAKSTDRRRMYEQTILQANVDIPSQSPFSVYAAKYLDRLLDAAPIGICLVNAQGQILALNKYSEGLLGVHEREALKQSVFPYIVPGKNKVAAYFRKAFNNPSTPPKVFLKQIPNQQPQYLEVKVSPLKSEGSSADAILIIQDVTDRMLIIEKEKERAKLVALNEAKDEFISLASHQLRTPATGVKQYIGMVLTGYAGKVGGQQKKMLETAYESNERQLKIVDDLLRVARMDSGKIKLNKVPTDINEALESILEEYTPKFKKYHQKLIFKSLKTSTLLSVDKVFIRMALENIIDNAQKYSEKGKEVVVRLSSNSKWITLEIEDKGVGIDEQDQKKLFRKFSRVENPLSTTVGGTGLGLYWAKKVIELHGGSIKVSSKINVGTIFTVKLPM